MTLSLKIFTLLTRNNFSERFSREKFIWKRQRFAAACEHSIYQTVNYLEIHSLDRKGVNQKLIIYMFILPKFWFPRRGFVQENSHL